MNRYIFIQHINQEIINNIKTMSCRAYGCNNKVNTFMGWKGCTKEHGWEIREMPNQIRKAQEGERWTDLMLGLKDYPIEAIEYYAKMTN